MRTISRFGTAAVIALLLRFDSALVCAQEGAPIPATPPFESPDIKPTFCDWLTATPVALAKKIRVTDPLLKPPFAGQPADSLKGMAAGIRAVQLDAPNRAKAAAYLGTVDCVTYPQAQAMLIATMQEDPSEMVRYEAVMALRTMMARGCSNMDTHCNCESCRTRKNAVRETERHAEKAKRALVKEAKGKAKIAARKANREKEENRYDCCRGCCNAKVMKALAEVAYAKDDQCCFVEPSERVREAAAEGLILCCVEPGPFDTYAPTVEPAPPADAEPGEVTPSEEKEIPPAEIEEKPVPQATVVPTAPTKGPSTSAKNAPTPIKMISATKNAPVLAALNGFCIVGLKQRQFNIASNEFSSVFEDHTYLFASKEAKAEFDSDPARYAPAYGGVDLVAWLDRHEMIEGRLLREYDGRFYLFSSKESWEQFKATPERFGAKKILTGQ